MNEETPSRVLITIMLNLGLLIKDEKFNQVDDVLSNLVPDQETAAVMITYLRFTYPARNKLPSWEGAVERTYRAFLERGLDAGQLLRGLMKTDASEGKPIC